MPKCNPDQSVIGVFLDLTIKLKGFKEFENFSTDPKVKDTFSLF